MKRVLHVIGSLNNGGSQAMIMNIYRNIDRTKLQFDFVIDKEDELFFANEIKSLGGKIHILPTFNFKNIVKYFIAWDNFFKNNKGYEIIHGHVRSTASIYLSIARKYGLKTIAHSHSTSSGKGLQAIVKTLLQYPIRYKVDYLVACSQFAGEWLFGKKACRRKNFFVINNAIDTERFKFNETVRDEIRKSYKLENKFVLGHVGRFHPLKNHDFLIDVFKAVYEKKSNSVLLLIGDGDQFEAIKEKVTALGIVNNVIFAGVRSDIPELMQAMDAFILPSLFEGLPVTLVEAQASGLPCLVADTISNEVMLTDLVNFKSLNNSPEQWADELIKMKQNITRRDMSKTINATGYSIKKSTKKITDFYFNIP